ncbi:T9SS type A sorting domain-containing protein [Hanstruepera marina]|uniref:T9SS type A sorting domain-containing protein n=1 Tax=Hanstruepera marina TaxID=2873265 RepID=UPI001CA70B89|nr:T9SS type A sorting domain-containing protein [Hanstruepera marina]
MNKTTYLSILVLCFLFIEISPIKADNLSIAEYNSQMQRVRLDFTMPNGYVRHLLLGFTPDNAATEGVDYGYDTQTYDSFPDDLNWIIDGERFVIQGVGEFHETNQYPLGMFLTNDGTIEISLTALENFDNSINVFVYDSILNTYTLINDNSFSGDFLSGDYLDRFFITFTNQNETNDSDESESVLSIDDQIDPIAQIKYYRNNNELNVSANNLITKIEVYNLLGKKILSKLNINSKAVRVKLNNTNSPYGLVRIYTTTGIVTKKIILQ